MYLSNDGHQAAGVPLQTVQPGRHAFSISFRKWRCLRYTLDCSLCLSRTLQDPLLTQLGSRTVRGKLFCLYKTGTVQLRGASKSLAEYLRDEGPLCKRHGHSKRVMAPSFDDSAMRQHAHLVDQVLRITSTDATISFDRALRASDQFECGKSNIRAKQRRKVSQPFTCFLYVAQPYLVLASLDFNPS